MTKSIKPPAASTIKAAGIDKNATAATLAATKTAIIIKIEKKDLFLNIFILLYIPDPVFGLVSIHAIS
jgi:hypothetical protein